MAIEIRPRRTQESRSASTKALLLDATIDCLSELGYANTTTTEIAKRAGVSRGAQLHHFPTKAELVTTAVEHLFRKRTYDFREAFAKLPPDADKVSSAIDILWSMVNGPLFHAWLELMVAARTDRELREVVSGMADRFTQTVQRTFDELLADRVGEGLLADVAPTFAFALLQGTALEALVAGDRSRLLQNIDALKALAQLGRFLRTHERME